jgi:hypothetical protein
MAYHHTRHHFAASENAEYVTSTTVVYTMQSTLAYANAEACAEYYKTEVRKRMPDLAMKLTNFCQLFLTGITNQAQVVPKTEGIYLTTLYNIATSEVRIRPRLTHLKSYPRLGPPYT